MKQCLLQAAPRILPVIALILTLTASAQALAGDAQDVRWSQSIEQPGGKTPAQQAELLDLAELQAAPELKTYGSREVVSVAPKTLTAAHLTDQIFRIYDAQTVLSGDDDADGFFHHLRVTFDADVDHADAFVYARLYLSFEGGPWNHYFTTNVFHILEDVSYDDYAVVTRLLEGYPTGYYDVLIELYRNGNGFQAGAVHQTGPQPAEVALGILRTKLVQPLGNRQVEKSIAKKFEALVIDVTNAAMRQRLP